MIRELFNLSALQITNHIVSTFGLKYSRYRNISDLVDKVLIHLKRILLNDVVRIRSGQSTLALSTWQFFKPQTLIYHLNMGHCYSSKVPWPTPMTVSSVIIK